jgi:hypothetical protein
MKPPRQRSHLQNVGGDPGSSCAHPDLEIRAEADRNENSHQECRVWLFLFSVPVGLCSCVAFAASAVF